ncbi:MAG TPA: DNA-directed RNA polymerase subunit K [Nitrososphaeraceae archaeon]|nr:DNA-directed RNA polymerase subunit K [Nitrososphaeraceae archaeon]
MVLKESPNKQSSTKKKRPSGPVASKSKKVSSRGKREAERSKKKADKGKYVGSNTGGKANTMQELSVSTRPKDEVVTYDEIEFLLQEVSGSSTEVLIGPRSLTRFEKARITGARSLQLSLGAPSLIQIPSEIKDSISLAIAELEARALPISIRRILPNGLYQDIPIGWLR